MKINKFEDIQAWKEARELTKEIYALTKKPTFSRDYGLVDQIRRAAISIMANIAEGFDSNSDAQFISFLSYSQRSASELQSHLYVALDQSYILENKFNELYNRIEKIKRLIGGFIKYLKTKKDQAPSTMDQAPSTMDQAPNTMD